MGQATAVAVGVAQGMKSGGLVRGEDLRFLTVDVSFDLTLRARRFMRYRIAVTDGVWLTLGGASIVSAGRYMAGTLSRWCRALPLSVTFNSSP